MIQFKPTRNIDLIEAVGNHPDIIAGSNNGDGYDYKPECRYFEVNVHGQFGGIVYYQEIQPLTFDCHAMYLPEVRGFSKEIGLAFWRYILTNTTVQCVTSFAARKFRQTYANNMSSIAQQSAALAAANANKPSSLQTAISGGTSGAIAGAGLASLLGTSTPWGAGIGAGIGLLGSLF